MASDLRKYIKHQENVRSLTLNRYFKDTRQLYASFQNVPSIPGVGSSLRGVPICTRILEPSLESQANVLRSRLIDHGHDLGLVLVNENSH